MDLESLERRGWLACELACIALGVWLAVVAFSLTLPVFTQVPDAGDAAGVNGTWQLALTDAQAHARIERGISEGVSGMPPIVDAIAAGQLRGRLTISHSLDITVTGDRIVVRFDAATYDTRIGERTTCPMAGSPSETIEAIQHFADGRLQQVFSTPNGRRWNTFVPSEDGHQVLLEVVVQSDRLPSRIRYALPYTRVH